MQPHSQRFPFLFSNVTREMASHRASYGSPPASFQHVLNFESPDIAISLQLELSPVGAQGLRARSKEGLITVSPNFGPMSRTSGVSGCPTFKGQAPGARVLHRMTQKRLLARVDRLSPAREAQVGLQSLGPLLAAPLADSRAGCMLGVASRRSPSLARGDALTPANSAGEPCKRVLRLRWPGADGRAALDALSAARRPVGRTLR
jgi:hypothetical protein